MEIIRDEFEEEISRQEILPSEYTSERGQKYPMFVLTTSQAKQVLVRESKTVRKAVINYIEKLETALQQLQLHSYQIEDPIKRAEKWIEEEKTRASLVKKIETIQQKINFDSSVFKKGIEIPKITSSTEKLSETLMKEVVLIRQLLEQQTSQKLEKLYTVKEFAEYIDTDVRFIDKIIKDHNIKVLTISERNRRIKESEIKKYINGLDPN